jgi:hypothetical protein
MATKYLYIDDDAMESLQSYAHSVRGETAEIEIEVSRPRDFDNDVERILEVLNTYDGIILDWRLDIVPDESGKYFPFRAGTLAQEIRTRQTEKSIKEFPIVLWSTYQKLMGSYYGDTTSQDLFDARHDKDKVIDEANLVRHQLISLAEGYKRIISLIDSHGVISTIVLGLEEDDYKLLPSRFTAHFSQNNQRPAHEHARFILQGIISMPGLLINEKLLAARLGIDKEKSSDWTALLEHLPTNTKYTGPFCDAWDRWWSYLVERKWWRGLVKESSPLSTLSANERVEQIKQHTKLRNLIAAKPIKEFYGDRFQTICEYYQKPLDPVDGVIINEKEPMPWQERRYLSIDAALERRGAKEGLRPHPTEVDRLKEIKKSRSEEDAET